MSVSVRCVRLLLDRQVMGFKALTTAIHYPGFHPHKSPRNDPERLEPQPRTII